jgi:hypothetical protein
MRVGTSATRVYGEVNSQNANPVVNTRLPPQAFQSCKIHRITDEATLKQPVPIRAALIGSDRCEAEGISVRAAAPVLALCRSLVAAGHDPRQPLHAYRGNVLALRVRSIGEGVQLAIGGDGIGFRRRHGPPGASYLFCQTGRGLTQASPSHDQISPNVKSDRSG